ncbi:MAG: RNA polymerase sigma-70 factor [Bacteroidota bacterium]|nr:RNA polymerase sigma-70 factor [Bacteroidota bacterium]
MIYNPENSNGEHELLTLLHRNHEKALEIIFKRYHIPLFYFAMQYLRDMQAAEDIVAESFIKFWNRRNDFECLAAIKSFLYTVVKNACLNQLKQNKRRAACHKEIEYLSGSPDELFADQKMIKAELLHKLWQDIERLPPVRRRIFKLLYLEGLNSFEVARALQISVDTVRVQKARALHALRTIVKQRL